MLAVPIHWRDKPVGVLQAMHRNEAAFNEEDLRLLEATAAWTAIAIGNARQYEQLQRRLRESDAMAAISTALTETLDLNELLQIIVSEAQEIIHNADWTIIHLLHPKTKQLELAISTGLEVDPQAYRINFGEGIVGSVMAHGGVSNVADVQADSRRLPIDLSTQARALLVVPVESRQRRIGTLSVQCATPNIFTADDERLLTILGVQAGMAIENARLYEAQREARERAERQRRRMRHMAQRVVEAQEEERKRIARELHDESGQSLTSLKISLDMIRSQIPAEMPELRENLDDVLSLADKLISNMRLLSHNLRPPGLDAYGINAALEGLCHDFKAYTALSITYTGIELPGLAPLPSLSLYRFAQEAMTNVVKHAQATAIQVTLTQNSDMITLTVGDNGRGFTPPDLDENVPSQGAGLVGMVERLEMVNGHLHIESIPEQGSQLTAVVPYTREER
jgi:signal transduction histidine kinase